MSPAPSSGRTAPGEVRDFLWWGFVEFPTVEVGEHCPGGEGGGGENFIKDFANESVKVEFSPLS